ncbi:MAG: HIT family protein [Candidatus Woesearchaeota archaeon]|jgi:histidine triad (HIT) family protein|nr:HIT family protein [Candidatus Woesearchaeota archaeon]MDP7198196.1 HIT family protein [Candidatus Woesearchaeota archaeon]MDP7467032.1 HIT family protein [Candidatus Woesearchaeota archaeon]MDP7646701.1 HIT family protein [Candidatus Woesearchaeota archaeon]
MTCLFCQIVKGEIPAQKIFEDEKTFAFLDIKPISTGHALVIPKAHLEHFDDMDAEDTHHVMDTVQKLAPKIMEAVGATAYNVGVNVRPDAGQAVMHTHVHIIPRSADDGLKSWPGMDVDNLEEINNKIEALL